MVETVQAAYARLPAERRGSAKLVYTAHSIPLSMAPAVAMKLSSPKPHGWFQSAPGVPHGISHIRAAADRPRSPGLSLTSAIICVAVRAAGNTRDVVVVPIGFLSDHIEVMFDLDIEAQQISRELELNMIRAATVGHHPKFVRMIRDLIVERTCNSPERIALGELGPSHDICPVDCCLAPQRPPARS